MISNQTGCILTELRVSKAIIKNIIGAVIDVVEAALVIVSGGSPLLSEYDGQVSFEFPVGLAGQQPLVSKEATLPSAPVSRQPAHWSQETDV